MKSIASVATGKTGLTNCTKGGWTHGMLQDVTLPDSFTHAIGVPRESIKLIEVTLLPCKSSECPFNVIAKKISAAVYTNNHHGNLFLGRTVIE